MGRGGGAPQEDSPAPQIRRKRQRRLASQIERKHPCTFLGCKKSYGSEGALKLHIRRKHNNTRNTSGTRPLARAPSGWTAGGARPAPTPTLAGYAPIAPLESGVAGLHSLDMAAHYEQQVALQLQLQHMQQESAPIQHLPPRASSTPWTELQHSQPLVPLQGLQPTRSAVLPNAVQANLMAPSSHLPPGPIVMHPHPHIGEGGHRGAMHPSSTPYALGSSFLYGSHHYQHMAIATQLSKIRIGSWVQNLHPESGIVFSVDDIRRDLCYTVELPQMLLRIVVGFESVASIKADAEMGETQIVVQVKESPAFYKTDPGVMPTTWTMTEDFTNGMASTFATHLMTTSSIEFAEQLFSVLLADSYFKDQSQSEDNGIGGLFHETAHTTKERSQGLPTFDSRPQLNPIAPPTLPPPQPTPLGERLRPSPISEAVTEEELQRRQHRKQLLRRQRQRRQQQFMRQRETARAEQAREDASIDSNSLNPAFGRVRVEGLLNECESILRHPDSGNQHAAASGDTVVLSNGSIPTGTGSLYDPSFDWADTVDYANQLPIPQLR